MIILVPQNDHICYHSVACLSSNARPSLLSFEQFPTAETSTNFQYETKEIRKMHTRAQLHKADFVDAMVGCVGSRQTHVTELITVILILSQKMFLFRIFILKLFFHR